MNRRDIDPLALPVGAGARLCICIGLLALSVSLIVSPGQAQLKPTSNDPFAPERSAEAPASELGQKTSDRPPLFFENITRRTDVLSNLVESLVIPSLELDCSLEEAIETLRVLSKELDPNHGGVSFVLRAEHWDNLPRIKTSFKHVPMSEAIKTVASLAGLKSHERDYRIVFENYSDSSEGHELVLRTFSVRPDFLTLFGVKVDDHGKRKKCSALEVLRAGGVPFPDNATASFNPDGSSLTIRNTVRNLEVVQDFLDSTVSVPQIITVRADLYDVPRAGLTERLDSINDHSDVTEFLKLLASQAAEGKVTLTDSRVLSTRSGLKASQRKAARALAKPPDSNTKVGEKQTSAQVDEGAEIVFEVEPTLSADGVSVDLDLSISSASTGRGDGRTFLETSALVLSGQSRFIGTLPSPDSSERTQLVFVKAIVCPIKK